MVYQPPGIFEFCLATKTADYVAAEISLEDLENMYQSGVVVTRELCDMTSRVPTTIVPDNISLSCSALTVRDQAVALIEDQGQNLVPFGVSVVENVTCSALTTLNPATSLACSAIPAANQATYFIIDQGEAVVNDVEEGNYSSAGVRLGAFSGIRCATLLPFPPLWPAIPGCFGSGIVIGGAIGSVTEDVLNTDK